MAARVIVGGAEAENNTTAMSMIADYFQREESRDGDGVFFLGRSLGVLGGFIVGGMVATVYGW